MDIWENMVALNSHADHEFELLGPAAEHRAGDTHTDGWHTIGRADLT